MKKTYKLIFSNIIGHYGTFLFIIFLLLLGIGFQILSPWPFQLLIDHVLGDVPIQSDHYFFWIVNLFHSKQTLGLFVVFLFFASNTLGSLVDYFRSVQTSKMIKQIVYSFSRRAFQNIELFDIGYYRRRNVGSYIYKLSYDVSALGEFIEFGLIPMASSIVYFFATLVILFTIDSTLTLYSLAILPALAIGLNEINKRITSAGKKSERRYSTLFTYVDQTLSQLKIIQAYKQEKIQSQEYGTKINRSLSSDFTVTHLNLLLNLVMGLLIAVSYSLIISTGITAVFTNQLSAGLLIVFMFYLDNLTSPILIIIESLTDMHQAYIKISHMNEIFNEKNHIKDTGTIQEIPDTTIRFRNVSLLGEKNFKILKNITCEIPKDTITALIGVSGSGKSSMTSLLVRLINEPTSGSIMIGDHEIREYSLSSLRNAIGIVPQETVLLDTSIRDIIAFGKPNATQHEISEAAKLAIADEFISHCPGGYSYTVGEQGNLLSGGQRQRLLLARAYVKNPKIMILDEIFASQDPETKQKMMHNLRNFAQGKTVLLVTNIFDILEPQDHVILMKKGNIIKTGLYRYIKNIRKYQDFFKPEYI